MAVKITLTYLKDGFIKGGPNATLATGEWKPIRDPSEEIKIEKLYRPTSHSTPKKHSSSHQCDGTPTTATTVLTTAKLEFNQQGLPEMIEYIDDDNSVSSMSTMGDSIYDDAKPSKKKCIVKAKHKNMMFGSFWKERSLWMRPFVMRCDNYIVKLASRS